MMEMLTTILMWWGSLSAVATVLVMLWAWRELKRQNEAERLRHSLGRQNIRGWRV